MESSCTPSIATARWSTTRWSRANAKIADRPSLVHDGRRISRDALPDQRDGPLAPRLPRHGGDGNPPRHPPGIRARSVPHHPLWKVRARRLSLRRAGPLRDGVAPMQRSLIALLFALAFPATAEEKQVTLGAAVQVTGPLANTGRYYRDAYQFAIDRINAKGGVPLQGSKARLALQLYDNQSDVNLGVRQYARLVSQDKVDALLGPFSSNDALDDS